MIKWGNKIMKKIRRTLAFILSVFILTTSSAFSKKPDTSAKSLICLDREYNFLSKADYSAISSGGEHVALIRPDNSLWMFGSNEDGKLGIGEQRRAYNAPIKVLEDVKKVKTSETATVAIKNDGSVWAFGKNAGYVPTKLIDNAIDADCDSAFGYIDKTGKAYFESYDGKTIPLCDNAKEIYVFFNSMLGNGLTGEVSADIGKIGIGFGSYMNRKSFFITVLKNDGSAYEYSIDLYGNLDGVKLIGNNIKKITVSLGSNICFIGENGHILYGNIVSGLRETDISGVKDIYAHSSGLYVRKNDDTVWNLATNECIGENVKLFAVVGIGDGVFMIHNDNSCSAVGFYGDYEARLQAVNQGYINIKSSAMYDDIYQKTMELKGNETDKYLIAEKVSDWIARHIKYKASPNDQSGVYGFRNGEGVCAAYADLTQIMFSYLGIPVQYAVGHDHAWNLSIIDGVTVFIDNTANQFDMGIFSGITDSTSYYLTLYDEWAATEVRGAHDYDLIKKHLTSDYRGAITRQDFCSLVKAVIEEAYKKDIDAVIKEFGKSDISVPFTDTTNEDVSAMYRLGIISGTSETTFSPFANIKREEAAKIMCGLAKTLGEDTTAPKSSFADNEKVSGWARDSVNFVAHKGIMSGKPEGFDPLNTISIQESILICYRYFINLI